MLRATALKPVENVSTTVLHSANNVYPSALEGMAVRMFHIYENIEDVMAAIYKSLSRNETKFSVSLKGKNKKEKQLILQWVDDMKGAIGQYHFDPVSEVLKGVLEDMPRVRTFILGGFMEIAITKEAENIVSDLALEYGKAYEVKHNVHVIPPDGNGRNEFDVVIYFDKKMYVIEVKTGNYFRDYAKYYNIGLRYGIVPNRILLVDSQLTDADAELAEYFSEYYVSNLKKFTEKLTNMIQRDMEVRKYA